MADLPQYREPEVRVPQEVEKPVSINKVSRSVIQLTQGSDNL